MKYAIIKVINGNYFIHTEGITDVNNAIAQYHGLCQTLWNAPDVITATVEIVDEKLNGLDAGNYKEFISHVQPNEESKVSE